MTTVKLISTMSVTVYTLSLLSIDCVLIQRYSKNLETYDIYIFIFIYICIHILYIYRMNIFIYILISLIHTLLYSFSVVVDYEISFVYFRR